MSNGIPADFEKAFEEDDCDDTETMEISSGFCTDAILLASAVASMEQQGLDLPEDLSDIAARLSETVFICNRTIH